MRRRAWLLTAFAVVAVGMPSGGARADETVTITRASGGTPFPEDGCGQIDHLAYGSQRDREADVSLAANPEDADHLVAAWIQDEGFGIMTATSLDGGATWSQAVVPGVTVCSDGPAQRVLHARLAFGPGGHVWVAGEVLDGYFPDPRSGLNGIAVAASSDGGLTWSAPARVETSAAMHGLNHIVADPSSPGSVVASWHTPEPVATSYLSRSDDGGVTWTATAVPAYAPDALPFQRLVIGPDGTYHLFTIESTLRSFPMTSAPALSTRTSHDHGATWTDRTEIAIEPMWQWPSGVVGPDGTVHAQWLVDAGNSTKTLVASRSIDGGVTWSPGVTVATGLAGPEPALAVTPAGVLATAYTAGVGPSGVFGQNGPTRELRLARSFDGGATWTTTVLDGPYATPGYEGFFIETAAMSAGAVAAVYTRARPDSTGPTDVYVAVVAPTE